MATAYSQAVQYNEYISPINLPLVDSVLTSKNQAYDANMAKVDAIVGQYEGLDFARPEDKQKMYENLQSMANLINSTSKMDMSNPNTVRQINSTISGTLTDELKTQLTNTALIRKFEQEVSDKKKKGDGTYSDINYTDALEQAGYSDYMRGHNSKGDKVDNIGQLNYVDFYDVDKNLRESINSWAKDYGITSDVEFQTNPDDPYEYAKIKSKSLTKEQVGRFFDTFYQSNPQAMNQMLINSRQMYKGYSDEEFKAQFDATKSNTVSSLKAERLAIEEELKQYSKDSEYYKRGQETLDKYDNAILQVKESPYNRGQAQMTSYTEAMKNTYQDAYAFKSITDIDKPNAIDLKKFQMEVAKFEYEYGDTATSAGTEVDLPSDDGTALEGTNIVDAIIGKVAVANDNIHNHLLETNESYRKADERGREAIINQMEKDYSVSNINSPSDPIAKRLMQERREAEASLAVPMKKARDTADEIANELYGTLLKTVKEGGTDLNIRNLSRTMPNTVKQLEGGKTLDDLPASERAIVMHELIGNAKGTLASHPMDKRMLELAEESYKNEAKSMGLDLKNKEEYTTWDKIKSRGSMLGNYLKSVAALPFISLTQGEEAAYRYADEMKPKLKESWEQDKKISKDLKERPSWYEEDTDLGSLQARDLSADGKNAFNIASDVLKRNRQDFVTSLEDNIPKMKERKGISFNPGDKRDKQTVTLIESSLRAQGVVPSKNSVYIASVKEGQVEFTFDQEVLVDTKSGGQTKRADRTTVSVPLAQVDSRILRALDTRTPSYSNAVSNPAPLNHTYTYSVPKTLEDKVNTINNLTNMAGTGAKPGFSNKINQTVKTKSELSKWLDYANTPQKQQQMQAILNSNYEVKVSRITNRGFTYNVSINGEMSPYTTQTADYTQEEATVISASLINQAIESELVRIADIKI